MIKFSTFVSLVCAGIAGALFKNSAELVWVHDSSQAIGCMICGSIVAIFSLAISWVDD